MKTTRSLKYLGALWCTVGGPLLILPARADIYIAHSNVEHSNVESTAPSGVIEDGAPPGPIMGPPPPLSGNISIDPISIPAGGVLIGPTVMVTIDPGPQAGGFSPGVTPSIPEPSTAALLMLGAIGMARRLRRR